MARITNEVLAEKIDSLHLIIKEDIKPAVKANTEFRLSFKGIIAVVSGTVAAVTAGATIIINKLLNR